MLIVSTAQPPDTFNSYRVVTLQDGLQSMKHHRTLPGDRKNLVILARGARLCTDHEPVRLLVPLYDNPPVVDYLPECPKSALVILVGRTGHDRVFGCLAHHFDRVSRTALR